MYHYFALRTSQVVLVVIETFLDLKVESREVTLSLGVLGAANDSTFSFSLIEMHLMEREMVGVFVVH